MMGDGRRVLTLPSALHALLEPPDLYPLRGGPKGHVLPEEIGGRLVGDSAVLDHDGHEPLLGPEDVCFSYAVQLLDRLARQRVPQGPAKTPLRDALGVACARGA